MYTAMFTLSCLMLGQTTAPARTDVNYCNFRHVHLPFNHKRPADIDQLALYVSSDRGKTWVKKTTAKSSDKAFVFSADHDGEYWLQVVTTDKSGRQTPENIYDFKANPRRVQKCVIDTHKPIIRIISAERQGDDILVNWDIEDMNPNWATFKLEYQVQPSLNWVQVQTTPGAKGQARIQPGSQAPVKIHLQMKDLAGNFAELKGVAGAGTFAQEPLVDLPRKENNYVPGRPWDLPKKEIDLPRPGFGEGGISGLPSPPSSTPPLPPSPPSIRPFPLPPTDIGNLPRPSFMPGQSWSPGNGTRTGNDDIRPVAVSENSDVRPPQTLEPRRKQLPALRYVNTKEVTLEYQLAKVGPSGVGSVDLWLTQDDGETWDKIADDPEARTAGTHKRSLPLPGDGVYGFILVVRSRAGLGRRDPRPGDVPDKRVEVDTLRPVAELYPPVPDPHRQNSLLLRWTASDKNLAPMPIILEWAEQPTGPWHPITLSPLANTGQHSWQLPAQLPCEVYLRVRAHDLAGNEGIATTPRAQMVDLSEPVGNLIDVTPQR